MAHALVKPGLIRGAVVSAGGQFGASGTSYALKIVDIDYRFFSKGEDVTGDGDEHPVFENNLMLYGDIVVRGAMISGSAIGLASMVSFNAGNQADLNPIAIHTFELGPDIAGATTESEFKFSMFVEDIAIKWDYDGVYVGVMIAGKMSGMTTVAIDDIQTVSGS